MKQVKPTLGPNMQHNQVTNEHVQKGHRPMGKVPVQGAPPKMRKGTAMGSNAEAEPDADDGAAPAGYWKGGSVKGC